MYDNLTANDIKKMQEEIEYRKLVVRREALEAVKEARALSLIHILWKKSGCLILRRWGQRPSMKQESLPEGMRSL